MTDALYQIMRFQILTAALTDGPGDRLGDAYVYAWYNSVYPIFDESAEMHRPFEGQFRVSKEMMHDISKYLDELWLAKKVPTFYEIEDHYEIRRGGPWDRSALIAACRYMCLHTDRFDKSLWSKILEATNHPAEASGIDRQFDHGADIYFH